MKKVDITKLIALQVMIILMTSLSLTNVLSQTVCRNEIRIPNILGYITLKCDFHMHTVFSDGKVWPTVRVDEAWREGLDAIALTDHIKQLWTKELLSSGTIPAGLLEDLYGILNTRKFIKGVGLKGLR